ncbi:hypothetical protein THRCLA_06318, partial [Thraustotheca clavata]
MMRRPSMTAERLEVILHDACDAMGRGAAPRSENWLKFILEAVSAAEKDDKLAQNYNMTPEMIKTSKDVIEARMPDIQRYLLRQAITMSKNRLLGFDYSVRFVMASNSLHGKIYPVVIMALLIEESNGSSREVHIEMTKETLDDVLEEFDAIEKVFNSYEAQNFKCFVEFSQVLNDYLSLNPMHEDDPAFVICWDLINSRRFKYCGSKNNLETFVQAANAQDSNKLPLWFDTIPPNITITTLTHEIAHEIKKVAGGLCGNFLFVPNTLSQYTYVV